MKLCCMAGGSLQLCKAPQPSPLPRCSRQPVWLCSEVCCSLAFRSLGSAPLPHPRAVVAGGPWCSLCWELECQALHRAQAAALVLGQACCEPGGNGVLHSGAPVEGLRRHLFRQPGRLPGRWVRLWLSSGGAAWGLGLAAREALALNRWDSVSRGREHQARPSLQEGGQG